MKIEFIFKLCLKRGYSFRTIVCRLNYSASTASYEVRRGIYRHKTAIG
ncbi:helix-turn-helix domain-containing protein [Lactobacillus sp. PSON]